MFSDVTILVVACPRPSNPDTRIIDETIRSAQAELPGARLLITLEQPTPEIQAQFPNYWRYLEVLHEKYPESFRVMREYGHQTGNLGEILPEIKTPLIYYVEDDWQTCPRTEFRELADLILRGEFNHIKLHASPRIHPMHEYLMEARVSYGHVHLIRTRQFSSNPHLASTEWYRGIYERYLRGQKTWIEMVMHGICGGAKWEEFKLGIYNPVDYDMFRVVHLDGKKGVL